MEKKEEKEKRKIDRNIEIESKRPKKQWNKFHFNIIVDNTNTLGRKISFVFGYKYLRLIATVTC